MLVSGADAVERLMTSYKVIGLDAFMPVKTEETYKSLIFFVGNCRIGWLHLSRRQYVGRVRRGCRG